MKYLALLLLAIATAGAAWADEKPADPAAHHPATSPAAPSDRMQTRMREMRSLMEQLDQTRDPKERERLLAQHLKAMHEQMDDMKRMDSMMECHEMGASPTHMMMDMMGQMMHREEVESAHH